MIELLRSLFVNPQLLGLAGLVSVPVIIYLINRHRYRRRKWAAMEFLVRALKKSQRRLQIQNLLLLLIRCLIVLLLALAVARPVLQRGPFVARGEAQNWIFVLDVSYSMDWRDGPRSLFDDARDTLGEVFENMLGKDDQVAVMTLSNTPRVLLTKSPVTPETGRRLERELADLPLDHRAARVVPTLRLLDDLTREFADAVGEPEPCNVVFLSDLQRKDWMAEDKPLSPEVREILHDLRDRGCEFLVAKLALDDRKANVAITELAVTPDLVSVGIPVEIRVTVQNFGADEIRDLDLSVRVDSDPNDPDATVAQAQLGEVISVPGGSTVSRSVPFRFDEPGFHTVVAEVRSDGLVVDNRRYLVTRVEPEVEVLLVDGEPAIEPIERETFYLGVALEPRDDGTGGLSGRVTPFQPVQRTADLLGDVDWSRYAVVVLANVGELPKAELAGLERYVAEGGALIVFLGPNVAVQSYNELLHRGGEGLLPVPLEGERGDDQVPVYLQFDDRTHPVASYFEEHRDTTELLQSLIPFYRYLRAEEPPAESPVRVLARYGDLDRSLAIFDNPFGRGRVMWFTSTADQEWNELPVWRDYVVLLYESIAYLVGFRQRTDNLRIGEPFERVYESAEFAAEVMLYAPPLPDETVGGLRAFRRPMREIPDEKRFRVGFDDTSIPGLYKLELGRGFSLDGATTGTGAAVGETGEDDRRVQYFAVNVDNGESDLRGMTSSDFSSTYGLEPVELDFSARLRDLERERDRLRGREYWRWCLVGVVLLLLLETALAQIFGRRAR